MSKDYKPRTAPRPRNSNPLLTGILIGVILGLTVAIVVAWYVPSLTKGFRRPEAAPVPAEAPKAPPPAAPAAAESKKPRFDFYNILPGTEEPVAGQETRPPAGGGERFFLQAGAFQNETDADNLKARLALMGVEASVQTVTVPDKGVLHRVRIGPFASVDEMSKVRAELAQNGIEASLIKVKEGTP